MKELVFKITKHNWGLKGPNEIDNIEWKIYNDYTVECKTSYVLVDKPTYNTYKITEELFNNISNNIELSKNENIKIEALDGEAWEFIMFSNKNEIYKRELDYIYGIESLENIVNILNKL